MPLSASLFSSSFCLKVQRLPELLFGAVTLFRPVDAAAAQSSWSLWIGRRLLDCYDSTSNARTRGPFRPRNANKGTSSYQLRQFAEATLGSGSLRKAVKLPEGEDLNEWLAVNSEHVSFDVPGSR